MSHVRIPLPLLQTLSEIITVWARISHCSSVFLWSEEAAFPRPGEWTTSCNSQRYSTSTSFLFASKHLAKLNMVDFCSVWARIIRYHSLILRARLLSHYRKTAFPLPQERERFASCNSQRCPTSFLLSSKHLAKLKYGLLLYMCTYQTPGGTWYGSDKAPRA